MEEFIPIPSQPQPPDLGPSMSPQSRDWSERSLHLAIHLHHTRGVGGFKFPKKSRYGERRRWSGDGHLGKELLKVPIERRRIEHIRKERVPTWHSKGRPTLGVPKQCIVDLGRHLHTPLHHWTQFSTQDFGWFDLSLEPCNKTV